MIDDESLTQYLDVHQTKDLGENYLEKIIKEKELENVAALKVAMKLTMWRRTISIENPETTPTAFSYPHSGTRPVDYRRSWTGNIPFRLRWRTHRTGGET